MARSILLSFLVSVLILAVFAVISQEYRTTMQRNLANPVSAAIAVAPMGETLQESSPPAINRVP